MTIRIRVHGIAGVVDLVDPLWLARYDPNAYDGRGDFDLSPRENEALIFPDFPSARDFAFQQPANHPFRKSDGKPNRPLSAFDLEFVHEKQPGSEGAPARPAPHSDREGK